MFLWVLDFLEGYGETCILVNVSKELRFSMEMIIVCDFVIGNECDIQKNPLLISQML